ncbi:hypothetical protein [Pendulispora albinea]|uniref:HEAT repeat domain-containing protein n=1 Tax=Pendulispora albinea TaxID=2741071 RepID=A0ABZ2LS63_9BACT
MSAAGPISMDDLRRLAEAEAPDLVQAILALLEREEEQSERANEDEHSADRMTVDTLRAALDQAARLQDKGRRQADAHEAWKRYLGQPESGIAQQIQLADLIVALYERGSGPARAAIVELAREAPLVYGIWGGLKRVYKLAEKNLDAEIFGALAVRFDCEAHDMGAGARDVKRGTLVYLQRRAWRFLRQLGKAVPELYPQFCVEVLRAYPLDTDSDVRIADAIEHHPAKKWGAPKNLPKTKKFRVPYREAWEASADPLMLLLETCQADFAASFAILGLRELFPDALRKVTPEWLGRLAFRPLTSAHEFLVETLDASPEFHQGKLKGIGLHEPVLALLVSPSAKARKYAIEYARGHAADMPPERLIELLEKAGSSYSDTAKFAASSIMGRSPRQLGIAVLGRLIAFDETRKWAAAALETEFERKELDETFFLDMLYSQDYDRAQWATRYLEKKFKRDELPLALWIRVLDDPRARDDDGTVVEWAMEQLSKFSVKLAPGAWILDALAREDIGSEVGEWLAKADGLPPEIDLERIKGLVFDPSRRQVAFALLGNRKLVSPGDIGLGWLLALARRADPQLHEWAHRYLLQHMAPVHFAEEKGDAKAGIARLFALALGAKEPEAVRAFAQTYLRCHHPKLGPEQSESKQWGIKSLIPRGAYSEERLWPALFDSRGDVRRFAVAITRAELRRWGAQTRVYELAESSAKEVRNIAYDALVQAGEAHADPELALTPEELDPVQIFSMTESRSRASRDVAIELIRKHYARIGGVLRLGWLMQSADREVRFFAVRLLWEKHRPRGVPEHWRPSAGAIEQAGAFTDAEALRALLKRLLFTVPPGRSMEQLESARARKLPASVAKRNLIEIVRDLAIEDAGFATIVAPVLGEFTGSVAKGEWQACLSALMTLRSVHGMALEGVV